MKILNCHTDFSSTRILRNLFFSVSLIYLSPLVLLAQTSVQLSVDTKSGYEHNAFNRAKNQLMTNAEGDTISSIQSGAFQYLGILGGWKNTVGKHTYGLTTKIGWDNYWVLKTANLVKSESSFKYSYAPKKTSLLYFKSKYLIYQTNRIPNEVEVIALPAAYKRIGAQLGYKWRLHKRNKTTLEMDILQKRYSPDEDKQLQYIAFGLNLNTRQKFQKKGKRPNYLSLELDIRQRNYRNLLTDNFGNSIEEETPDFEEELEKLERRRIWRYYTAESAYDFRIGPSFKLTTGLSFQYRKDVLDERFGYQQWRPFVETKWSKSNLSLSWKMSVAFRTFTDLKADKQQLYPLAHTYWRNRLMINYQLSEQWTLSSQINIRKRGRNQPPETTNSYLPYFTSLASVGIRYKFNKKFK